MTHEAAPLLEVRNLRTDLRSRSGLVHAVDDVSLELAAGETLGIVGESGSGKTVTVLSITRLLPDAATIVSGNVIFDGRDLLALGDEEIRRVRGSEIGMIFQDPLTSLNPVLSVGVQITEVLLRHHEATRKEARGRAIELLQLVGIPAAKERIDDYPHQFSGGMRQRVMIAIALACRPKLIVADEPTTALDVTVQAQILELLRAIAAEFRTAFILITHDLGVVAGMADRVHVMYGGRIVEKADTSELFANPKMPYTWGLLGSIPRIGDSDRKRLVPIPGLPPSLVGGMRGCRFAERCPHRRDICREQEPPLANVPQASPDHQARCWATQAGGWLVGVDWRDKSPQPLPEIAD